MKLRRLGLIVLMWILIMGVVQGGLVVFAGPMETAEANEEDRDPSSSLQDDLQSDKQSDAQHDRQSHPQQEAEHSDEGSQEAEAFEIQEAEEPAASEPQGSIEASEEQKVDLAPNAKSAILMDVDTGTIIYREKYS